MSDLRTPEQVAEDNTQFTAWYIRELCRHAQGKCHGRCVPATRARSLAHTRSGPGGRILLSDNNVADLVAMHEVTVTEVAS